MCSAVIVLIVGPLGEQTLCWIMNFQKTQTALPSPRSCHQVTLTLVESKCPGSSVLHSQEYQDEYWRKRGREWHTLRASWGCVLHSSAPQYSYHCPECQGKNCVYWWVLYCEHRWRLMITVNFNYFEIVYHSNFKSCPFHRNNAL